MEVSRERAEIAYDGGPLGCGSSGNCRFESRYRIHRQGNLRRDLVDGGSVCRTPGEAVLELNGRTTVVVCR